MISRFRLPSAFTKDMGRRKSLRASIRDRVAPLWEWHEGENELARVISSDGYSLVETPLFYSPDAEPDEEGAAPRASAMRVWIGTDPLMIATTRSDLYVDAREAYLREFEPTTDSGRRVVARTALAQAIHGAVLEQDDARIRHGKLLREGVGAEVDRAEKKRRDRVKMYESRAAALCKVLDDALFQRLLTASLDDELNEPGSDGRSIPVSHAAEALGVAARRLDESRFGRALFHEWVSEAERDSGHFVNRIVLPASTVHVSAFKAFRWGAKGLANILKTVLEHRVALRKVATRAQLAELLEPAIRLTLPDHASQHIVDTDFADAMVSEVEVKLQRTKLSKPVKVKVPVPGDDLHRMVFDWWRADEMLIDNAADRFLGIREKGAMVLDGLNVILAMNQIAEAEGSDARTSAMWSTGAAGLGLMRTVADQALNWSWVEARFGVNEARALGVKRVLAGMGGARTILLHHELRRRGGRVSKGGQRPRVRAVGGRRRGARRPWGRAVLDLLARVARGALVRSRRGDGCRCRLHRRRTHQG